MVPQVVTPDLQISSDNTEKEEDKKENEEKYINQESLAPLSGTFEGTLATISQSSTLLTLSVTPPRSLADEKCSVQTLSEASSHSIGSNWESATFPLLSWRTYDNRLSQSGLMPIQLPDTNMDDRKDQEDLFQALSCLSLGDGQSPRRGRIDYTQSARSRDFMSMNIPDYIPFSPSDTEADKEAPSSSCGKVAFPSSQQAATNPPQPPRERRPGRVSFSHFPIKPLWSRQEKTRRHTSSLSPELGQDNPHHKSKRKGKITIPRLHDLPVDRTHPFKPVSAPDPSRDPCPEDFFQFEKVLGVGSYGKVHLARFLETGELVAIKVQLTMHKKRAEMELKVLSRAYLSPFLTSLHSHFSTMLALYLVMEYVPGGKFTEKLREPFSLLATAFYSAQIVLALTYLHGEGILYRDLKPDNVLLTQSRYIKLCDFGSCSSGVRGNKKVKVSTGTPRYWAPEKFHYQPYGRPADWWSLGVIVYQMLMGTLPFASTSTICFDDYKKLVITKQPEFRPKLSAEAISLCEGLLNKDPEERLGGPQESHKVYRHPFYRRFISWGAVWKRRMRPPPMYASRTASVPAYRE